MQSLKNREDIYHFYKLDKNQDIGFQNLIDDIVQYKLPNNQKILINAIKGNYSDYETCYAVPITTLIFHLRENNSNDDAERMIENAKRGRYDHDCVKHLL
jgi:hypothetical protein